MKNKTKKIKFQYFVPCSIDSETEKQTKYSLLPWMTEILNKTDQDKIIDVKGVKGRCEEIINVDGATYYAFNFMRLDEVSDSYIVKEDEKAEHIDLNDDEYIGKNTVVLYDSLEHILMIQVNRGGYSYSSIETYINYFLKTDKCFLRPILEDFNFKDHKKINKIKKIEVRFANIKTYNDMSTRKSFENVVKQCNKFNGLSAKIEININRDDTENLNDETMTESIYDIKENESCISSAKIYMDDDKKTAVFDLFDNFAHDYKSFTVPERGELGLGILSQNMKELYKSSRRGQLVALLQTK